MTTTTEPTVYEGGTVHHVPPGTLLLERNIRDAKPDADLVASVAAVGVLEPIVAVVTADGRLLVRHGQRRTLAAIEAQVEHVAVYVAGEDDARDEIHRIISQRDENTHRTGLTTAEELNVVAQLAAFGLSADEISDQARIAKDRVHTAIAAGGSKVATKAATKWEELSLEQVAAIAEFEDDKDAVAALVQAARDGRFDHTVQRMRDDKEAEDSKRAVIAELEAAGVKVVERPAHNEQTKPLDQLVEAKTGNKMRAAAHAKCAGHVGWAARQGYFSGNYQAAFGCTNPSRYGHRDTYSSGSSKPKAADMSENERAAAKLARRLVIENNRAWTSATTVRRRWLTSWAKIKTPPKGAAAFIAISNTRDSGQFDYDTEPGTLCGEWLGLKERTHGRFDLTKAVEGTTEARALVIALVYNLAVYETHLAQQAWRIDGTHSTAGRYLRFLASCGYPLSEVEEFAISKKTVD